MRIAFLIPTLALGGVEKIAVRLSAAFADSGADVDLVVANATGPLTSAVTSPVKLFDLGSSRVLTSLPRLVRYLRDRRPDVLISSMDHTNVVALYARRLARVPTRVIVTTHCLPAAEARAGTRLREKLVPFFMRRSYRWADAWIAVSAEAADQVAQMTGIDRQRIEVVANPVISPELFTLSQAPIQHEWFSEGQPPVVLGVGRLVAQKRFDTLLEAFAHLDMQARLLLVGDGPERANLVARAAELGIESRVSFTGLVANPYPYIAQSAVLVLPSAYEAFGLVLVEALALGTPVVSTNTAGGREILGGSGPLVPVGDVTALASAIRDVLYHPKRPDAESLARYNVANVVAAYQRIIARVTSPGERS